MSIASFLNPLIAAAAGLVGVFLGSWGNDKREREKRKADFLSRQLTEFYGPMLGLRTAIKAHSELRVKLQVAQDSSWTALVNDARQSGGPDAIERLRAGPLGKKYEAMLPEEDRAFREIIFPWYQKMVEVFREKISLAEIETRVYLPDLIEYVEVWDRFLQDKLPGQVSQALGHTETKLHPFYANIEKVHDRLRAELAAATRFP